MTEFDVDVTTTVTYNPLPQRTFQSRITLVGVSGTETACAILRQQEEDACQWLAQTDTTHNRRRQLIVSFCVKIPARRIMNGAGTIEDASPAEAVAIIRGLSRDTRNAVALNGGKTTTPQEGTSA